MHKKGISLNSVEKSLSHSADKIRTRTLLCFERILVSKSFKQRRGEASRFCRNFLSHRTEKTSPGNHSVFQKIFGREKNLWIRGGGGITIFRRSFLSHCTEIFHWRTLWCFRKILLSKIFLRRRGASPFCRNFMSHRTETKSFVKEPFCFPEIFWYRKKLWIRGGISRFSVEIFISHSAENFRKEILLFLRKFLVSKSFMDEKGGITFFRQKFLVSQCRKMS